MGAMGPLSRVALALDSHFLAQAVVEDNLYHAPAQKLAQDRLESRSSLLENHQKPAAKDGCT